MTPPAGPRVSHPVFAAFYPRMARGMEAGPIGSTRRALLAAARGVVVDLGAGVGLNLPHLGPDVSAVHAVEPDPHMVRRLTPNLPPGAVVHQVGAETLPLPDASVDTVLATLTLCTVQDPAAAVREIRRVLRPDGQVLVLEHVLATDPGLAAWQHRMRLPWRWFGAGCNPTRDTTAAFAAAGFDVAGLQRIDVPGLPMTREWVTGVLPAPVAAV
ncbi:class I SAM-dependent methyltransferase [Kineosporia sp. A_224]|uniref:class I SAM-dependent methyltransferase n=1 Tax=Kineosporia sp. A_224 TaxID=1962180 RepID=UPI0018E9DD41|nr:class I SAM-dependent methyltransferase [Kineosporia sp. A_224]